MSEHTEHNVGEKALAELKEDLAVVGEIEAEILEEMIDLEEWAKAGREPRRARRYRIRIDKQYFVVEVHSMTGAQILALAGKAPQGYMLSQKLRGGRVEPIESGQTVEFHRHQIERFQTLARDAQEG